MIKLSNIRLTEQCSMDKLRTHAARILRISESDISDLRIIKQSADARRKPDVRFVYTISLAAKDEEAILRKKLPNVSQYTPPDSYSFPIPKRLPELPPVIVGTGPAGLFAALCLAEAGIKCVVLERGQPVEQRTLDVERFWRGGALDTESNVQFGEGGAGTFSDGKLTTGINDVRIQYVLERFVEFGAPQDILYLAKPHVGTDNLRTVVIAIRNRLLELGCDIRFGHKLSDIFIIDGTLNRITVEHGGKSYEMPVEKLLLAPGNSARDTFTMLSRRGVLLTPKNFSVGVRIEHLQRDIDLTQYGAPIRGLPPSDYKLAVHLDSGRTVYTFCVCPGGSVVASSSETGSVVTNGMSEYARDNINCNGALLVTVTPDDFCTEPLCGIDFRQQHGAGSLAEIDFRQQHGAGPLGEIDFRQQHGAGSLGGIEFQRKLERAAFTAGGGDYYAPAQLVGDFLQKRATKEYGSVKPTYLPGVRFRNLWDVLPDFVCRSLAEALPELNRRIKGFASPDAVLTAVETRSSSPVRIERENYETVGIRGIFPCGEGAGYAGGIISAAVDGIKCAERIANQTMG